MCAQPPVSAGIRAVEPPARGLNRSSAIVVEDS
jgi:hypothetical protein